MAGYTQPSQGQPQQQVGLRTYTDEELDELLPLDKAVEMLKARNASYEQSAQAMGLNKPVQEEQQPATEEKRGVLGTLGTSALRGLDQTQGLLYAGAGAAGAAFGLDGVRDWGFEGYQRNMKEAEENKAEIGSYKNINSIGDAGTYALETLGELAPSLATMIATGGAGGLIAGTSLGSAALTGVARTALAKTAEKQIAKHVAAGMAKEAAEKVVTQQLTKTVGKMAGAWAGSSVLEAGGMYGEDAETRGIDKANPYSAIGLGMVSGATDIAFGGEGALIRRLAGKSTERTAKELSSKIGKEVLKSAGGEMGQEIGQELIAMLNLELNNPGTLTAETAKERVIESGLKGGIGGVGFGAGTHVLNKMDASIAERRAQAQAAGDVETLRKLDYEQQIADMEAKENALAAKNAANEESEMRRMSGEDISSILQQRRDAVNRNELSIGQERDLTRRNQRIIDSQSQLENTEQQIDTTTPEGRQAVIDREFAPEQQQRGTTPMTAGLGVGLDSIGTINNAEYQKQQNDAQFEAIRQRQAEREQAVMRQQQAELDQRAASIQNRQGIPSREAIDTPANGAMEQEWNARQEARDNANFDREFERRRLEQIAIANTQKGTPLEQKWNDKIRRRRAGLNEGSVLTSEEIEMALTAAHEAGMEVTGKNKELQDMFKSLEETKSEDPTSDYMGDWLDIVNKIKPVVQQERKELADTMAFVDIAGELKRNRDAERAQQAEAEYKQLEQAARTSNDPAIWRQYREAQRQRRGTEVDPGFYDNAESKPVPVKPAPTETVQPDSLSQANTVQSPEAKLDNQNSAPEATVTPVTAPSTVSSTMPTPAQVAPAEAPVSSDTKPTETPMEKVKTKLRRKREKAADVKSEPTTATVEAVEVSQPAVVQPVVTESTTGTQTATETEQSTSPVVEVPKEVSASRETKADLPSVETVTESDTVPANKPVDNRTASPKEAMARRAKSKIESSKTSPKKDKSTGISKAVLDLFGGVLAEEGIDVNELGKKLANNKKKNVVRVNTEKTTRNEESVDDIPFMRDDDIIREVHSDYSEDRPLSSDDGEYFSRVKKTRKSAREMNDTLKEKKSKNSQKADQGVKKLTDAEGQAKSEGQQKPESPVKKLTPAERAVLEVKAEQAAAKERAANLTEQAKLVFGKDTKITGLESGNIIAVLKNGAAILVRQQDVIIANEKTGDKAYGSWMDESVVAEKYGVKLNRGGIMSLAKYQKGTTALHESFHVAMSVALSPTERKMLLKEYGNEEAAAEAYENWIPDSADSVKAKGLLSKIRSVFRGIANMFIDVDGPKNPSDVFKKIRKGDAFKKQTTRTENMKGGAAKEARASFDDGVSDGELFSSRSIEDIIEENPDAVATLRKIFGEPEKSAYAKTREMVNDLARGESTGLRAYMDMFYTKARESFDSLDRIRVIEEAYNEKTGGDSMIAYWSNRLASSVDSIISSVLQHGAIKWENGVSTVTDIDKGLLNIARELGGKNTHYWLMRRMVNRAEKLMSEGRENYLTEEDIRLAREIVEKNTSDMTDRLDMADREYERLHKSILEFCTEAGIISDDFIETVHSAEYIPFYRVFEDNLGEMKDMVYMPSGTEIKNGIKKLEGGESAVGDLLTNVVKNWSILITQAVRNNARKNTIDMALKASEGMTNPYITKVSHKQKSDPDVLNIMTNGNSEYYRINDRTLFAAMDDSLDRQKRGWLWKAANKAKRALTIGATSAPPFVVKNFIRDSIQNVVFDKRVKMSDIFDGVIKAFTEHPDFIELKSAGAAFSHGYLHGSNPKSVHNYIEEIVVRDGKRNAIKRTSKQLWDKWQKIGSAMENANRIALYSRLKEEGKSNLEAAYEAKDLLDFSMRGNSKIINDFGYVIPFLNARLAGLYKLKRALTKKNEDGALAVAHTATMLVGASVALMAYNMTANKDRWEELEDHERWTCYHLWTPDGEHFRIPKPFEVGAIFSSLPEVAAEVVFGKEKAPYLWKYLQWSVKNTFAINPTPQLVKPLVENWANKDSFTERAIVPFGMEFLTPTMQYRETTPESIKSFTKFVEILDGDLDPDFLEWVKSPVRVEHMIRGYFATLGTMTAFTADMLGRTTRVYQSKQFVPEDYSAGLMKDDSTANSRYVSQFYELAAEIDRFSYTINAMQRNGDTEGVKDYLEENINLAKAKPAVARIKRTMTQLRHLRTAMNNSDKLTAEQKYEKNKAYTKKRNELARELITKYNML